MNPISGRELVRLLKQAGFEVVHIKGSHQKLRHPDGRHTVVPAHANENLKQGTLRGILADVGWNRDEYERRRNQ